MPETMHFKAARRRAEPKGEPPDHFIIDWDDEAGEWHHEKFVLDVTLVPQMVVMRAMAMGGTENLSPIFELFQRSMGDVEYQRFINFSQHPEHELEAETFVDIAMSLFEKASGFIGKPAAG